MNSKEISAAGFTAVRRSPKRLIASIQGHIKCGKTRLALTGRKPMGYISIEIGGDEGVVDQFIKAGQDTNDQIQIVQIRMADPVYPDAATFKDDKAYNDAVSAAVQAVAEEAMEKFYAAYYTSLANFETTIVDTGSDLWELIRLANFGRLEKVPQLAYTQLNKAMDKILDDAYAYKGSVLFTHHVKEKWQTFINDKGKEQGKPSGIFDMAGYSGIKKKVQAVIELWREDLTEPDPETGLLVGFHGIINDSRHNAASMGQRFKGEFTLADIGMCVIPSAAKDWV